MRNLNKILRIANMQKRDWKSALFNYLLGYRISPNMSTKGHTGIPGLWTHELDAGLWTLDS